LFGVASVINHGLTLATTWASGSSYISLIAPPPLKTTAQTLLMLLYHGIGKGFGSVVGGFIIKSADTWKFIVDS
uniref:MFS domain-containing protein n=1 Tax=Gongylonema pulchrum TaxID=637853 RepID=A0A183ENN3_9BILA